MSSGFRTHGTSRSAVSDDRQNPFAPTKHDEDVAPEAQPESDQTDPNEGYGIMCGFASLFLFPAGMGLWAMGNRRRFHLWAAASIVGAGMVLLSMPSQLTMNSTVSPGAALTRSA